MGKSSEGYQHRVVAFVDILGFKSLVAKGKVSTILKAMEIIRERVRLIPDNIDSPLQTSQFSDSLILSAPNDGNGVIHLVHFVSLLTSELFLHGIWCRGAITSGKMHHEGSVAFGPALIDAIEMECRLAVYPRILVTYAVADRFVEAKNNDLPKHRMSSTGCFFRRDIDHLLHLNIFSPFMFIPQKTGTIEKAINGVNRHVIKGIDATETPANMNIQAKLFWIVAYIKEVKETFGAYHFTIPKQGKAIVSAGINLENS